MLQFIYLVLIFYLIIINKGKISISRAKLSVNVVCLHNQGWQIVHPIKLGWENVIRRAWKKMNSRFRLDIRLDLLNKFQKHIHLQYG